MYSTKCKSLGYKVVYTRTRGILHTLLYVITWKDACLLEYTGQTWVVFYGKLECEIHPSPIPFEPEAR